MGNLVLVGSDLDRQVFSSYLADGALDVPRHLSIYVSDKDKALGVVSWLTRRDRLGQLIDEDRLSPAAKRTLEEHRDHISMIDVSDAEGADAGHGHDYFRASPWVSSDILSTLMYDLTPKERTLTRTKEWPMWKFPPDYIKTLAERLAKENPALAPLTQ